MKLIDAILIESDAAPMEVQLPEGLAGLQAAVRGNVAPLPGSRDWQAFGAEAYEGMMPNLVAHGLLVLLAGHGAGDIIRGPVVLVGRDGGDVPVDLMCRLETAARALMADMRAHLFDVHRN